MSCSNLSFSTMTRLRMTPCKLLWLISITVVADSSAVLRLLRGIEHEKSFDYLVLMRNRNFSLSENLTIEPCGADCVTRSIMNHLETPVMQLDEHHGFILHDKQSSRVLFMVYLAGSDFNESLGLLKALVNNMSHMITSRVVFIVPLDVANNGFLHKLFTYCWQMKLLNVLAIFGNFEKTKTLYRYTPFPSYQLEEHFYGENSTIFPDRLKNFYGYSVRVAVGGAVPRIIAYRDKHGKIVYRGALGHFMNAFGQKFNCTLTQPNLAEPNKLDPSTVLVASVRNKSVDISFAITFPIDNNLQPFSYPFELMNWCIMLPVEADIPPSEYYIEVFELPAFLLTLTTLVIISTLLSFILREKGYNVRLCDYLLHDSCLRGALGQCFPLIPKASSHVCAIYLQICLLGFLLTTWYNAYFSAFVTSVPKKAPFRNFDDIMASKLKVVAWESEYNELIRRLPEIRKYAPMFLVEPSFSKFMKMGDSFDTRYGFMTTSIKWVVINEQQTIFRKPLFRMRNDMCLFNNIPLGFPVHENTIYRDITTKLIMQLAESGLQSYWTLKGFSELVEAGELQYLDHSLRREFRAMQLQDLKYVCCGFAFMVILSFAVFLLELLVNWFKDRQVLSFVE